ncbi:MAG: hypothetical protein WC783_00135 [Candidatus Paceibacterota bacterium]|jgi:hypothetical protein
MKDKLRVIDQLGNEIADVLLAERKGNYASREEELSEWDSVLAKFNISEDEDSLVFSVADGNVYNWVMKWLNQQGSLKFTLTPPEVIEEKLDAMYNTLKIVKNKLNR